MKPFTCHFAVKKQPGHGKEAPIAPSTWSFFEVLAVNALELWQMLLSCSVSVQTVCWQWQVCVVTNPCPCSLGSSLSAEVMPAFLLSYALVTSCFFSFRANSMSLCKLCMSGRHSSALSASMSALWREVSLYAGISEQLCFPDLNFQFCFDESKVLLCVL